MSLANRMQQEDQPSMVIKVIFVGDSGVGKTSLINREYDDSFVKEHLATIGVDFRIKTYDLGLVKVKTQLWDTAGQERFRSIQKPYYKNAKAICLCFSLNDRKSFENLSTWIDEMIKFDVSRENMFLIGCKSDLDIEVATDQILIFAIQNQIQYHQTSSREGEGVNEAFRNIMINCAQRELKNGAMKKQEPQKVEQVDLKNKSLNQKKACC